jgi:hypothetical protein
MEEIDFTREETLVNTLESVLRWTWRTDSQEPFDVVKAIRTVVATELESYYGAR